MIRASGESGRLRVGYQEAAKLGKWSLVLQPRLPREYTVRAELVGTHAYWFEQQPLDLVLHLANVAWVWRGITLSCDGRYVTIALTEQPIVEEVRSSASRGEQHG